MVVQNKTLSHLPDQTVDNQDVVGLGKASAVLGSG